MTHFESYHWEDHVPRAGSWKLNLAVAVLAFGLISAAMPDDPVGQAANGSASAKPAAEVNLSALEQQRRIQPSAFIGRADESTPCPHADS